MKADTKLVDVAAIPLSRPAAASSPQALADSVLTTEVVCVCVCVCVCVSCKVLGVSVSQCSRVSVMRLYLSTPSPSPSSPPHLLSCLVIHQ